MLLDKDQFYLDAKYFLRSIKDYLIEFFDQDDDLMEFNLFKTVYTTLPMVDLINERLFRKHLYSEQRFDDMMRLVYAVMTTLNEYLLGSCPTQSKYDYLFLFKFTGTMTKDDKLITTEQIGGQIKDYLQRKLPKSTSGADAKRPRRKHKYSSLEDFYENHIYNKYSRFAWYNTKIEFYWRGQKKHFGEIYEYVTSAVLSSFYLYEIYDYYFKFLVAALYLEINQFLTYKSYKMSEKDCGVFYKELTIDFSGYLCLKKFDNIFNTIDKYMNSIRDDFCKKSKDNTPAPKKEDLEEKIASQFKDFGVCTTLDKLKSTEKDSKSPAKTSKLSSDQLENVLKTLMDRIKKILNSVISVSKHVYGMSP